MFLSRGVENQTDSFHLHSRCSRPVEPAAHLHHLDTPFDLILYSFYLFNARFATLLHLVLTPPFLARLSRLLRLYIYTLYPSHSLTVLIFYYIPWLAVMYLIDRFLGV